MANSAKANINQIRYGFFPGLFLPMIIFVIMYFGSQQTISLLDFITSMWQLSMLFKLLSLCVLPNLILFLYFYRKKYDMAARGVLMATFIYAFAAMISKAF